MLKAIIFDLFGTLTNGQANPEKRIVEAFGLPQSPEYFAKVERVVCGTKYFNDPLYFAAIKRELGLERVKGADATLRKIFEEDLAKEVVRPEAEEVLQTLRGEGVAIGLISDLPNPDYYKVLKTAGIQRLFDERVLSYETGILKPNPEVFYEALERLGINPDKPKQVERTMMVGNSPKSDIIPADEIGMRTLLMDPTNKYAPHRFKRIKSLKEVLDHLD